MFELVKVNCAGSELHGLHATVKASHGTVIHLHGTWGNFYANKFIQPLADFYNNNGWDFLTVNLPGHDETAIFEKFDDSLPAISAWIAFAKNQERIILQGHSLGALKAIRFMGNSPEAKLVTGLVLLSPFDIVAFYSSRNLERTQQIIDELKVGIKNGLISNVIPTSIFDLWMISYGSLLELITPGGVSDIFNFRDSLLGSPLKSVSLPTFVAVGGSDFAAFPTPEAQVEQLSRLPNINAKLIEGGNHGFEDTIDLLTDKISEWLKSAFR